MPTKGMVEVSPEVPSRMTPFCRCTKTGPGKAIPTKWYTFSLFQSMSTAIDAPEAASADPCISQRVDDTFRKAQTERRATQLLTPGERSSPSQLDLPSRRGCSAVPSRWASTVVPGASGAKKRLAAEPRARRSRLTKIFRSRLDHKRP